MVEGIFCPDIYLFNTLVIFVGPDPTLTIIRSRGEVTSDRTTSDAHYLHGLALRPGAHLAIWHYFSMLELGEQTDALIDLIASNKCSRIDGPICTVTSIAVCIPIANISGSN